MADTQFLDLTSSKRYTLGIKLPDKAGTVLTLRVPKEGHVARLQALLSTDLPATSGASSEAAWERLYEAAAELMSINRDLKPITAAELRDPDGYNVDPTDLLDFFSAYMDFIGGLKKN